LIGIEDEYKAIRGKEFFVVAKTLHHLLQGGKKKIDYGS